MREEPKGIQSVEIAMRVLDAIVEAPSPLRLKDAADLSGLAANKARMYLLSLIRAGLVEQDGVTGLYATGRKAMHLGIVALGNGGLLADAQNAVLKLSEATGDPVLLSVWDHDRSVIVATSEAGALPMTFRVGKPTPLYTATGTVLIAYLAEAERQAKDQLSPDLLAALPSQVNAVKVEGYATADEVRLSDGISIKGYGAAAAPIFGGDGRLAYVLTALLPASLSAAERSEHTAALVTVARTASGRSGA